MKIKKNILLSKHTTFRIGGPAKYFCEVKTLDEINEALYFAKKNKLSIFILGGGSNLLISDAGFNGLVIKVLNDVLDIDGNKIKVGCGVLMSDIIEESIEGGLSGLEWASGIPGTVGGAIRGNAGAFGGSMSDIVKSVVAIDLKTGKTKKFSNRKCRFGYRESIFKENTDFIIWSAELAFTKGEKSKLENIVHNNIAYRKDKHPLNYPSCGSVFKNIHDKHVICKISAKTSDIECNIQKWGNKIPAAYLIDRCGLKNMKVGGAMVSEKQPNFIINFNDASAEDVIILVSIIKEKIGHKFGIVVEEEVKLIGF